jgi:threonine aldolase
VERAVIDLRSDTVTRPSPEMRRAMASAEVGDDVFGEDPTVRRLEERTAAILGKEDAIFVPSGTMGNQIALRILAAPGSEVIAEARAHILHYEMGGMAALSGLMPRPVETPDGLLTPALAEAAFTPDVYYRSRTGAIAVENTHNLWGGKVMPRPLLDGLIALARRRSVPIHLDGARLWNASAASGESPAALSAGFDTVNVCFSKGLGAPIGSALASRRELVAEARRARKLFGGGMRQAGVIAAAALVSLESLPRLPLDHANARRLAEAFAAIPGASIDPAAIETNIVLFEVPGGRSASALVEALRAEGVLAAPTSATAVRFVTHRDVDADDIDRAAKAVTRVLASIA